MAEDLQILPIWRRKWGATPLCWKFWSGTYDMMYSYPITWQFVDEPYDGENHGQTKRKLGIELVMLVVALSFRWENSPKRLKLLETRENIEGISSIPAWLLHLMCGDPVPQAMKAWPCQHIGWGIIDGPFDFHANHYCLQVSYGFFDFLCTLKSRTFTNQRWSSFGSSLQNRGRRFSNLSEWSLSLPVS